MLETTNIQQFLAENTDIELFEVLLVDLNGNYRGKWVPRDQIAKVYEGGFKLPITAAFLDPWGRDVDELVFEKGDEDGICIALPNTLCKLPWGGRPIGHLMVSMGDGEGNANPLDGRTVLQNVVARFAKLGLTPVVASEMEFCLFDKETDELGRPVHDQQSDSAMFVEAGDPYSLEAMLENADLMHAMRDAALEIGLPVDTVIKEAGQSQYEINLQHRADAVLAADEGTMLKRVIRSVAPEHDLKASFMAKPFENQPGNGMHTHISLIDGNGVNVFATDDGEGTDLLKHAVAGCLKTMPEVMLILAPNVNSYRRFVPGSYAPMAQTWGYENRTTAIRIPAGDPAATRIEHRVSGADANPYLVIAAILAGMLYGIENKLTPPPDVVGDAYEKIPPSLPRFMSDALEIFADSEFVRDYLGPEFQHVYSLSKNHELNEFARRVTLLEYDAYL